MFKKLLNLSLCLGSLLAFASTEAVLVIDSSIILEYDQSKELYFSFAEGDEVIINLKMIKGKHIKEVEMTGMPSNTMFSEFKTGILKNKKVSIRNKGIYKLRFYSSSLTRRVCKLTIHRKPKDISTQKFNTNWRWDIKRDTVYTNFPEDSLVGNTIIRYQEVKRELKQKKFDEIMIFNKSQKVHSYFNPNLSRTFLRVDLPQTVNTDLRRERVVAWSYWIGVDNEGQQAYENSMKTISKMVNNVAGMYTTPLGGLAVGALTDLMIPKHGEDVEYYFIEDYEDVENFMRGTKFYLFDSGKGRAAYGRNDSKKYGTFYICLSNDNLRRGIEVEVKVLVVKEIEIYEDKLYDREREEPKYISVNKTKMNVIESRIRVPVE